MCVCSHLLCSTVNFKKKMNSDKKELVLRKESERERAEFLKLSTTDILCQTYSCCCCGSYLWHSGCLPLSLPSPIIDMECPYPITIIKNVSKHCVLWGEKYHLWLETTDIEKVCKCWTIGQKAEFFQISFKRKRPFRIESLLYS